MKTEFNKEIQLLMRNQTEMMLEMKNSTSQSVERKQQKGSRGKQNIKAENNVEKGSVDESARRRTGVTEMESEW